MTNCPNCGAPFTGGKCAYCGTEQPEERREYRSMLEQTATTISLIVEPIPFDPECISKIEHNATVARMGAGA